MKESKIINVVNLFGEIFKRLSIEQKCGECFEFSAPFFNSNNNVVQPTDPCCVQVRLVNYTARSTNNYTQQGFIGSRIETHNLSLEVLKQSQLGINMFNETKGYDTDTSRWATKYYPLLECFASQNIIEWCMYTGLTVEVPNWDFTMLQNHLDGNYDGFRINLTLRIRRNE